jgi:hypothetical protein
MRRQFLSTDPDAMQRIIQRATEEGDCLLWDGVYNNGSPQVYIDGRYQMVRRVLWQLSRGDIPQGLHPRCTCGEPRCISLDHIRLRTVRQIGRDAAKTGAWNSLLRRVKIAAARRKNGKLTQTDVDRIRAADNGAAIARELGISKSAAQKIRTGKAWAPLGSAYPGWMGS